MTAAGPLDHDRGVAQAGGDRAVARAAAGLGAWVLASCTVPTEGFVDPRGELRIEWSFDAESATVHDGAAPADNPFVNDASFAPETFAWGLRNPWRFSFDRETGDLWIGDVGQSTIEEIDLIPAGTSGQNFGWSIMEGNECYNAASCDQTGLTLPVDQYTHDYGCSVTGGYVYRGSAIPDLVGTYLFADYCTGYLWGLTANGDGSYSASGTLETGMTPSSFAQDASGELYFIDLAGAIYRIAAG